MHHMPLEIRRSLWGILQLASWYLRVSGTMLRTILRIRSQVSSMRTVTLRQDYLVICWKPSLVRP